MLILFDLDDTLLDHRVAERGAATALHAIVASPQPVDTFVAAWAEALERHFQRHLAGELTYQEQRRARIRDVVDPALADAEADRLLDRYLESYESHWSLFADVLPCLAHLAAHGHRLGIVTNGQTLQQRRKLAHLGLLDRFDTIVVSEACGVAKPAAEIFLHACAEIGEPPSNAMHIGDRYDVDAQGARAAGLCGIWLDRHGRAAATATPYDPPIITSLAEIPALIDGRQQSADIRPTSR